MSWIRPFGNKVDMNMVIAKKVFYILSLRSEPVNIFTNKVWSITNEICSYIYMLSTPERCRAVRTCS